MSRIMVLYRSKHGAARRYAQLLAGELNCPAMDVRECRAIGADCELAVFAGGVYAGRVAGLDAFGRACRGRSARRAVLCVGASPPESGEVERLCARLERGGQADMAFYARGAWDERALSLHERALCALMRRAGGCEPWLHELLAAPGQRRDWVDARWLQLLLARVLAERRAGHEQ